jgi:spore germination protein KA
MWQKILKKLRSSVVNKNRPRQRAEKREVHYLSANLDDNIRVLKQVFSDCGDVTFREFYIGTRGRLKGLVIFVEGLAEKQMVNNNLLKSLMYDLPNLPVAGEINKDNAAKVIKEQLMPFGEAAETADMIEMVNLILAGDAAFLVDGSAKALVLCTKGWDQRAVQEPETETVVRGPREGFTESLRTNTVLIRRRIKSTRLKMENMKIGLLTKTDVNIAWIEGIADNRVVQEVRTRLGRINTDSILESGYLEEFIEDAPFSLFPMVNYTERPDKAAAALLEGRVAVITDTTPMVLIAPVTFVEFLQSSEDYYLKYYYASFLRLLRIVTLNIALLLPALYVAIVTYHQELLPTPLLISIAAAREGVPFPAFVEALLMETTFEVLREAGVRLPRPVGQAVSIVGALVIGEAAVTAGLVSPAMVIVVALTAIASFTIPSFSGSFAIRLMRFPIMAAAAVLGLFGIMAALLALLIHLCSLRSFGVPYVAPIAPTSWRDLKDVIVRAPWWKMFTRPRLIGYKEPDRQETGMRPKPPKPEITKRDGGSQSGGQGAGKPTGRRDGNG